MAEILVKLPKEEKRFPEGTTALQVAEQISHQLAKKALAAEVNGEVYDLLRPLPPQAEMRILTFEDEGGRHAFRHTSTHVMAQAIKRLFPEAKLAIGPALEDTFYYDVETNRPLTQDDLDRIAIEMSKIVAENEVLQREVWPRAEALAFFKEKGEDFKVEIIEKIPEDEAITVYRQGEFIDLCAGPHLPTTGKIKAFKLLSVAQAYWRGDEKGPSLQRVYGTSWEKAGDLQAYITRIEEAKKRDHRKIGRELELFSLEEEGPGFPFWHPKGMVVRNLLEELWRKAHRQAGYVEIKTPIMLNQQLWERSGHWAHYRENMYVSSIEENGYAIKPMNCPGAMLYYATKPRSYRELPLRVGELGLVHRHERSGTLHGLFRVRSFTQDDAHLFVTREQIKDELVGIIRLVDHFYRDIFGFDYRIELSTRPEDSIGSDADWEAATNGLTLALAELSIPYRINEGDGAFYGPKIDFHLHDSLGRTWQTSTVQLDFQLPERFDLHYVGADGTNHRPVVIHRVVYGSVDRFIGILIEEYFGAFPTWLAPVQVKVLPISEKQVDYAGEIYQTLQKAGIRAELDSGDEKIGYKIRQAQLEKVPYMVIVGEKEKESGNISLRARKEGDLGSFSLDELVERLVRESTLDGIGRIW